MQPRQRLGIQPVSALSSPLPLQPVNPFPLVAGQLDAELHRLVPPLLVARKHVEAAVLRPDEIDDEVGAVALPKVTSLCRTSKRRSLMK